MTGKELEFLVSGANLTITEAATLLGVSRQTLYAWYGKAELKEKDVSHIQKTLSDYKKDKNIFSEHTSEYNKSITLQPLEYSNQVKQVPFSDFMETEYLPVEAQAGYLDCLESQDTPKLDTMLIPKEYDKGNYLVIEIKGDSMNDGSNRSIQDGDKLLCKELQKHHWTSKRLDKIIEIKPKYEAISSHCGRRTFVTIMSVLGLTSKEISLMSGHTQQSVVDIYDKSKADSNATKVFENLKGKI